jgi:hypothetical protein
MTFSLSPPFREGRPIIEPTSTPRCPEGHHVLEGALGKAGLLSVKR